MENKRIRLQGKMNKGVYICYECGFKAPNCMVVPYMLGITNSEWG